MSTDASQMIWGFGLLFGIPLLIVAGPQLFVYLAIIGGGFLFVYLAALGLGLVTMLIPATCQWGQRLIGRLTR